MKKIIAIIVISVLSLAMIGCSCASCGCGGGQNVPSAKGEVSIAYDKAEIRDLLSYYQANQGYVVTFVPLEESTDFAKLSDSVRVAVVKDEAVIEQLKAAGWIETEQWTEAQKASNEKLFGLTVLELPNESGASLNKDAVAALTRWLSGEAEPLDDLVTSEDFAALKN